MEGLVSSTGNPAMDAELAIRADVVLCATDDELVLLRYSPRFRTWYACGCLAEAIADQNRASEARLNWEGVRYMDDASIAYIHLDEKPLKAPGLWDQFYRALSRRQTPTRVNK